MPNDAVPEIPVSNLHNPLAAVAQSVNVAVRALNQLAQDVPDSTSDLTNDSGFITNAVTDLLNYYLKSETYTKAEVNALISTIPKLDIQVVSALPSSGISTETIYLVTSGTESQNLYTEYVYVGNAWEKLGTQTLDLSGYATTAAMNAALSGKVDKVSGKQLSTNDYTTAEKNAVATIGNKVDKVTGKGLSAEDYTTAEKSKLSGIAANATANAPASATPLMDGTAAVGTSAKYAREDHVHPTDTSHASAADVTAQGNRITALESENALLCELLQGIDAPVYREASGNPAVFHDGYPANVRALSVTIAPTQSGSGEPSLGNIRPITGATSVTVTRTGENGANAQSVTVSLVDSNNDPLTVYGGTLNVTTGELTATHKLIDLSTVPIRAYSVYANSVAFAVSDMQIGTRWADGACSHARISTEGNDNGSGAMWLGIANNSVYWLNAISLVGAADLGEFTTWLSGAGVQLLYPLATPVTYQLTPAQLATLSGYNSVTTDAGTLSVAYRADTKLSLQ